MFRIWQRIQLRDMQTNVKSEEEIGLILKNKIKKQNGYKKWLKYI